MCASKGRGGVKGGGRLCTHVLSPVLANAHPGFHPACPIRVRGTELRRNQTLVVNALLSGRTSLMCTSCQCLVVR
jgi:hypothetical protein